MFENIYFCWKETNNKIVEFLNMPSQEYKLKFLRKVLKNQLPWISVRKGTGSDKGLIVVSRIGTKKEFFGKEKKWLGKFFDEKAIPMKRYHFTTNEIDLWYNRAVEFAELVEIAMEQQENRTVRARQLDARTSKNVKPLTREWVKRWAREKGKFDIDNIDTHEKGFIGELEELTVPMLKHFAKGLGIKGFSKMKKDDLVSELKKAGFTLEKSKEQVLREMSQKARVLRYVSRFYKDSREFKKSLTQKKIIEIKRDVREVLFDERFKNKYKNADNDELIHKLEALSGRLQTWTQPG
jgi:hypothetical protein